MSERVEVLEIDLTEIQEEAVETGKTLKDLRKEVKDLRAQLENTEMGTADFTSTLEQLIKKQQELTNVTKSGVKAQAGSYNDLVNQMALLKKEWRAAADESERAAIGQKIGTINARLKELDASLGNYQRNVGNYQGEMHELATDIDAVCGAASSAAPKIESYNSEVSGLSKSTGTLNTTSTDWVQTAENTVKVTAGMTGAFQAAQGAINLMGIESEATTQMIAQMQNVMAITEGLKAISEGIESFDKLKESVQGAGIMAKLFGTETQIATTATNAQTVATKGATIATNNFKKALIATGIGAFIVLLGTLIAKWEDISKLWKDTDPQKEAAKRLKDIRLEVEKLAIQSSTEKILRVRELAKAYGDLGDNLVAKQKFVTDYTEELNDMGIKMNDVNDAERIFKEETEDYCNAIKARAKAEALREVAATQYAERMAEIAELNSEIKTAQEDLYEYGEANQKWWQWVDAFFSRRYGKTMPESYKEDAQALIDTMRDEAKKLQNEADDIVEELFADATKQDSIADELLITDNKSTGGSTSGDSGGSKTPTDDWETKLAAHQAERLRVLKELNQIEFDALQAQRTDQYDIEIEELKRAKEQEEAVLFEYLNNKLINEKTGEEHLLLTQEEYDKAKLELAAIYGKRIAEVEKSRLDELNRIAKERLDAINKRFQDAIQTANAQYEISSATAAAVGDEVTNARALQTLLDAQNQALVTKRDELLAYKAALGETSDEIPAINAELEAVTNEMALNTHNRTMAIAAEKAAQLDLINEIVGSVAGSMDQLLALDLGSKWADELGMAFSAIQNGISQTSDALKSGQKGWQAYGQMAASGLNAAAGILNSIAEKQDEESKEGFEKQKKLQIAAATMSMLAGVVSAVTSAFNPANAWMTIYGQAAAAAAMSALTLTTGAIQIANIKKQTLEGSSDGSSTPVIPSLSAINAIGTPVSATTNIEGASVEANVKDTKVYVLESDITSTQNNVKATVDEATF